MLALPRRSLLAAVLLPSALALYGCGNEGSDAADIDQEFVDELMVAGPLEERWLGTETAPVVVIEYASMTCPHCRTFHLTVFDDFVEEFVDTGGASFLLREFPLDLRAEAAFMIARCAPGEDAYYAMVGQLFEAQDNWAFVDAESFLDALFGQVQQAGFTRESFEACLSNQQLRNDIVATYDRGVELGVNSTPTFFINGRLFNGALGMEELRRTVLAVN